MVNYIYFYEIRPLLFDDLEIQIVNIFEDDLPCYFNGLAKDLPLDFTYLKVFGLASLNNKLLIGVSNV